TVANRSNLSEQKRGVGPLVERLDCIRGNLGHSVTVTEYHPLLESVAEDGPERMTIPHVISPFRRRPGPIEPLARSALRRGVPPLGAFRHGWGESYQVLSASEPGEFGKTKLPDRNRGDPDRSTGESLRSLAASPPSVAIVSLPAR